MRITYCFIFIFSLTVILMPQRHRRAARNLTVTVMISVTVIMTAWVTEDGNYPMTIIIWLARVILMVRGWRGHRVFPLANNWIISYLFTLSVSDKHALYSNVRFLILELKLNYIECFMIYHMSNCWLNGLKELVYENKILFHMYWFRI